MHCNSLQRLAVCSSALFMLSAASLSQTTRPSDIASAPPAQQQTGSSAQLPHLSADYARAASALAAARRDRDFALENLERTRTGVREQLTDSSDVERARTAMQDARQQYDQERGRVIDGLQSDKDYIADRKKMARIDATLNSTKTATLPEDKKSALAQQRLDFATQADHRELSALEKNPNYEQAEDRYMTAARRYQRALDQIEQQVERDPQVRAARQRWENACADWQDARMAYSAAEAAYLTALAERRQDLYYRQTHGPGLPWYPYGYDDDGLGAP